MFWLALFADMCKRFGTVDCGRYKEVDGGQVRTSCRRLKSGVWVDLVGMLVAFGSATGKWLNLRKRLCETNCVCRRDYLVV